MILTQEQDTTQYIATMEAANRATENALFYNIGTTCVARNTVPAPGYPDDLSYTNPNDSVVKLNGNGPTVGPAIILKVMAGDSVDVGTQFYYNSGSYTPGGLSPQNLLNSLASGLATLSSAAGENITTLTNPTSSPLLAALTSSINNNDTATGTTKPQAYLNWVLLDKQFRYVAGSSSGAMQVGAAGQSSGGGLQPALIQRNIRMSQSGYLYIYVSNATKGWDVFFDNMSVHLYTRQLLEENHYYPFGLGMAGISDKAVKTRYAENKYRFNKGSELQNKEFADGSGLEIYETPLRSLDPQLGRWWQIDPVFTNGVDGDDEVNEVITGGLKSQSPYASMDNNPISRNDPQGDCPACVVPLIEGAEAIAASGAVAAGATSEYSQSTMGPGEAIVAALNPVTAYQSAQKLWNNIAPAEGTGEGAWSGGSTLGLPTGHLLQVLNEPSPAPTMTLSPSDQDALNKLNASLGISTAPSIANPTSAVVNAHGNTLNDKPAEGYSLRDKKTGDVKKFGETTRGEDKYGAGNQKRYSKKELKKKDVYYQKEKSGTKKDMHQWQHEQIQDHKDNNNGQRPDLNKNDY